MAAICVWCIQRIAEEIQLYDLQQSKAKQMMFPKHEYIRSPALLRNARKIPCQHCGADDGTVVAAHTNWGGGKGRGIKASDNLIASLCFACHSELDQGKNMTKEQRKEMWHKSHIKTVDKLVKLGLWPDNVPKGNV